MFCVQCQDDCSGVLGSPVALSKWNDVLSRGEVVERYGYDAFGRTRIFDAAGGGDLLKQGSEAVNRN